MNKSVPDEFRALWGAGEHAALASAWDALDAALPEPPSPRMRRRLRRLVWRERLRGLGSRLSLAGMAAALVAGVLIGRLAWHEQAPRASETFQLETKILAGATTAARLEAIVNLRRSGSLPADAVAALAGVVQSADASTGVRLAALDALLAHADQPVIQAQVIELLQQAPDNPMLEARLREMRPVRPETQL